MDRFLAHSGAKYPIVQAPMGWLLKAKGEKVLVNPSMSFFWIG